MPKKVDLTNIRVGRLTVLCEEGKDKSGHYLWRCRCDCGKEKVVSSSHLRNGAVQSCGCLHIERTIRFNKETKVRHGKRNTRLYAIWAGMKRRTMAESSPKYNDYGGRNITMCEEWRTDFASFYEWAMTHGYQDGLSIDRADNDGPYSPENCRWVTMKTQGNNRRGNRIIEYKGEKKTLSQWAEQLGIPKARIYKRAENDLPVEELLYPGKLPTRRKA